MKASKIAQVIERIAPKNLAEKWDNPGFQVGSVSREVENVLLALEITPEVIQYALDNSIEMIVSHHPFFFNNLKNINTDTKKGQMIETLIKHDIVLYSAHTNLDKARGGLNTYIAKILGLTDIFPLIGEERELYKFIVYFPAFALDDIQAALLDGEVGIVDGAYRNCTFRVNGIGTFEAEIGAHPSLGEIGILEEVEEIRLETVVEKRNIPDTLRRLKKVHPYEEVAYDLIKDEIGLPQNGLGIIGKLKEKLIPEAFISLVSKALNLTNDLREAGPRPKKVKKVAVLTGAGAGYINQAKHSGADVYITGDLKHHDAQNAWEKGLWVLDCGHYGTEKLVTFLFEEIISAAYPELNLYTYLAPYGYLKTVNVCTENEN